MMFNIRNYRSDISLGKVVKTISKSGVRASSEVKQNGDNNIKTNYHYTQKRDLSEYRTPETKKIVLVKSVTIRANSQPQSIQPAREQINVVQQSQSDQKALDLKLPDLRNYQLKPPKPQLPPIKYQTIKNSTSLERPSANTMGATQKPPLSLNNHTKGRKTMHEDSSKLIQNFKNQAPIPRTRANLSVNNAKNKNDFIINYAHLSKPGFDGYQLKTNQDMDLMVIKSQSSGAFGVMDGHGQEGEKVSQFITQVLKNTLFNQLSPFDFKKVFPDMHELLKQQPGIASQFSGTTATLTIVHDNIVQCGWVGDSRAILGQRNKFKKMTPIELSKDHKPDQYGEKARIEQCGGFVDSYHSATGAQLGPFRVWVKGAAYPGLAMSRSLGDCVAASVGVSQIPDVTTFEIKEDDLFMIVASDGIWEFISNQQAVDIVYPFYLANDPQGACDKLYSEAYAIWKKYDDGIDDITSIVVFFNRE